jgi:hypothetical protein
VSEQKLFKMELTKEEVEWVINRKKILDHIYLNREKKWMPYIYPDHVYQTYDYSNSVWEELKKQIEV